MALQSLHGDQNPTGNATGNTTPSAPTDNSSAPPWAVVGNGPGNGGVWEGKLYYFVNPLSCALAGKPLEIVSGIAEKTDSGYLILRENCQDLPVARELKSEDLLAINFMPEILMLNSSILEGRDKKPVFEKDGDQFIWMACTGNFIDRNTGSILGKAGGTIRLVKDSKSQQGIRIVANVKVSIPKEETFSGESIPVIYKHYENHTMLVSSSYHEEEQIRFRSVEVLEDPLAQEHGDQYNRLGISIMTSDRHHIPFGKYNAIFHIPWSFNTEKLFHFKVYCNQINPYYIKPGPQAF